jgi:hypothetical protein
VILRLAGMSPIRLDERADCLSVGACEISYGKETLYR